MPQVVAHPVRRDVVQGQGIEHGVEPARDMRKAVRSVEQGQVGGRDAAPGAVENLPAELRGDHFAGPGDQFPGDPPVPAADFQKAGAGQGNMRGNPLDILVVEIELHEQRFSGRNAGQRFAVRIFS